MAPNLLPGAPSAVAQAPQSKVGKDAFDQAPRYVPEVSLAAGLEQFASGLEDLAVPLAKQQGAADAAAQVAAAKSGTADPSTGAFQPAPKTVALDSSGLPQVLTPDTSVIFGRAGLAYDAARDAGVEAGLSSKISRDLTDIRNAHQGDPNGFMKAADDYSNTWKANYPGAAGTALLNHAADIASRHYESMANQQATLGLERDKSALTSFIADKQSAMQVMARNGGIATPDYLDAQRQLTEAYTKLGNNSLFGIGPERAQSELSHDLSTNRVEYTIGQAEAVYAKSGKAAALDMLDKGITRNEDLNLPVAEREKLLKIGIAHIGYLASEKKAEIDASRTFTKPLLDLLRDDPSKVTPAMRNDALSRAGASGDAETVLRLQQSISTADDRAAMRGMTDEQRLMAATRAGVGPVPGASGRGLINAPYTRPVDQPTASGLSPQTLYSYYLAKGATKNEALLLTGAAGSEGVYNPQAVHDGGIGYGLFGHNRERLDAMRASAGSFTPTWQQQADFSLKELRSRPEGAAANAATSADQLADAQMAYERPRAYTPDNPRGGENYTGRLNTIRYLSANLKDSPALAPGSGASMGLRTAPTQAEIDRNPYAMKVYAEGVEADRKADIAAAKNVGEALIKQYTQGNIPPPEVTAAHLQMADRYPADLGEQGLKVRNLAAGADLGQAINNAASPAERQQHLSEVEALMRSGDLNSMAKSDEAKIFIDRGAKALKADPWNEMNRRGWLTQPPTPLDLSTPQGVAALPQSIGEHVGAAVALTSHTGVPASIFSPTEMPAMKAIMEQAPIDMRVHLASTLMHANMPEPIRRATLEQLTGDKETTPLAVAGDIAPFAPQVAHDILQGQALLQTNDDLAPKKESFPTEFAKILPFNDFPDAAGRGHYDGAIRALYAKRTADKGDLTGIINQDRLDGVVKDITGGVLDWRGGKAIAPWYGATQDQYDAAIRTVTDADLAGSRGSDGVPLPAAALKPSFSSAFGFGQNWSLQSVDAGKYLIYPNDGQMPRRYLQADPKAPGYNPKQPFFVLDLGAKRQAVEAQGLGLAPMFSTTEKFLSGPMNQAYGTGL